MKRVLGYILFMLGMTFIFLGPFLRFYTYPRVQKAPTDVDNTVISDGHANYFSPTALSLVGPTAVQSIERYKGDLAASTDDVVVINYAQHLVQRSTGDNIDFDKEVFAMNRKSGFAVNCCGEDPKHSGLELKFPFDAQKTTYQFWDSSSDQAFPAKYVGTETIDGVEAYHYVQNIPPTRIGTINLPGSLIGKGSGEVNTDRMYQAAVNIWAEPVTGSIIKGSKHAEQWAADGSERLLELADVQVEYSPATVSKLADDAKTAKDQLQLVSVRLPIALPIIGILLVAGGVLLIRQPRAPRRVAVPQPAATAAS